MPIEIRPLISAVNQALDRLAAGYQRQQEFTADVAHELRTPLAILRTRLDTIRDRELTEAIRQDLEGMCRIVSQLLENAELDTFVIRYLSELADLHAVCAEVAEFVVPLVMAQSKDIALEAPDEPVWIRGNAEMLYRAVRNLVENAINYTPRGTTVEITVSKEGTVVVSDHGPGIQEVDRDFLFHRFWRRNREAGGAGLGTSRSFDGLPKHMLQPSPSRTIPMPAQGSPCNSKHANRSAEFIATRQSLPKCALRLGKSRERVAVSSRTDNAATSAERVALCSQFTAQFTDRTIGKPPHVTFTILRHASQAP